MNHLIPEKRADDRLRCVQDNATVVADARTCKGVYTIRGKRTVYTYSARHKDPEW